MVPEASAQTFDFSASGLSVGDTFRLIYRTDSTIAAQSQSLSAINTFVDDDAAANVSLTSFLDTYTNKAGGGTAADVNWRALVSTDTVTARANTLTTESGGVQIFNVTGDIVASTYANLWDGNIDNAISSGTGVRVWTGTSTDGTPTGGEDITTGTPLYGISNETDASWIAHSDTTSTDSYAVYGISDTLTVTAIPTPALLPSLLGFAAATWRKRKLAQTDAA